MLPESEVYQYFPAKKGLIGLISIPHSGEIIPSEFVPYLLDDSRALAEDVDYQVDKLVDIDQLNQAGIAVIVAKIHRTCVDLNRPPENAVLNWKLNSQGIKIVTSEPDLDQYVKLRQRYYTPYFDALEKLIGSIEISPVPVIDFHSMPSKPTDYHLKQNPDQKKKRPDFCISDLKGKSCSLVYISKIVALFAENGFEATFNDPYFGGYVTKFINQFKTNNIQVETKRALYMDEGSRTLHTDKVCVLKPIITNIFMKTITEQ